MIPRVQVLFTSLVQDPAKWVMGCKANKGSFRFGSWFFGPGSSKKRRITLLFSLVPICQAVIAYQTWTVPTSSPFPP